MVTEKLKKFSKTLSVSTDKINSGYYLNVEVKEEIIETVEQKGTKKPTRKKRTKTTKSRKPRRKANKKTTIKLNSMAYRSKK